MKNLIPIPKFIPLNVSMTPFITPTLTNTAHTNVATTPNTAGQTWNTNVIKVNSTTESEGGIIFDFENLEIGDFIELSCEYRAVSGDAPILKISEYNKNTNAESVPSKRAQTNSSEWRTAYFKAPVTILGGTYNHRAFIGLEVGKSGHFELRGVRATAYSKTNALKPEKKEYIARLIKVGGVLQIQAANSDSAVVLEKPYTYLFQLKYPKTSARPIVLIQNNKTKQYIVEASDANDTTVSISFATIAGASVGDIDATLPSDIMIGISIKWV